MKKSLYMSRSDRWQHFSKIGRNVIWTGAKLVVLFGISFIILFPLISKISTSIMPAKELHDATIAFIPRNPTLENYLTVIKHIKYFEALKNTATISLLASSLQVFVSIFVGYGLAKFKFRFRGIVLALIVFTIMVPPQTVLISLYMKFRFFDVFGVLSALTGGSVNFINTIWPVMILSSTGLAFKNGLYIFIMRQYYKGIPEELEEAAYVDGSGVFRTFFLIIVPMLKPMMVVIFLLAFAWQWTDYFYSSVFFSSFNVLSNGVLRAGTIHDLGVMSHTLLGNAMINAASILLIIPLIVIYLFVQKKLIQGIERSGIVG
ncbi:carbohydrate ABC transporter permease [Candidatus Nomurabacteria bacterium]|nr:carbohydrate ABC transporter permease [Candidatus Nomurabacteria bacterium]